MKRLTAAAIVLFLLYNCSFAPGGRRVVEDDFVEPVQTDSLRLIQQKTSELKDQVREDFNNAALHRRLSILYRLAGTPRSRLMSLEEIEKAIELDPRDPRNHVEKGLTMLARRFVGEAENCFQRALKLDPGYFEAWYQLGRLEQYEYLKTMCFTGHLKKAVNYFKKAYRLKRHDADTLYRLGLLHLLRHMPRNAANYTKKAIILAPDDPRGHLLVGIINTELRKFEAAEEEYGKAFALMDEKDRGSYEDISILLPQEEKELYLTSTDEKKMDWNRRFWVENDPTPSTTTNERLLEHYRRVFLARELLSDERLDLDGVESDRGKALVSYGLPTKKFYDLASGQVGPWIIWRFVLPHLSFDLYFHDEFLNGNFHFPISDKAYGEASIRIMNSVPQSYEYPVEFKPVPISIESAQLRGKDERTRIEFSVAIPDSALIGRRETWDFFVSIFDEEWNRTSVDHFTFRPDSLLEIEKLDNKFLVYHLWIELLPRPLEHVFITEVVQGDLKVKGIRRFPVIIKDFYGRSLKLSSIKLNLNDEDGGCSSVLDPIPAYDRVRKLCLEYQVYNLKMKEDNIARYRVTYSIKNPGSYGRDGSGAFRKALSNIWAQMKGGKEEGSPYITSSLEQSVNDRTAYDNLQIELGELENGTYLLVLKIEDLISGEEVTEERLFTVMDRS